MPRFPSPKRLAENDAEIVSHDVDDVALADFLNPSNPTSSPSSRLTQMSESSCHGLRSPPLELLASASAGSAHTLNQSPCEVTSAAGELEVTAAAGEPPFSILTPGSHIYKLTDINPPFVHRSHLPLIIPDGARFRVGADIHTWEPGKLTIFDGQVEHEVINEGKNERVILIDDFRLPVQLEEFANRSSQGERMLPTRN